jgi:hypothetical protein
MTDASSEFDPGPPAGPDPFTRFNARVLDPTTAGKLLDGSSPSTTAYVSDRLLVTAQTVDAARELLAAIDAALTGTSLRRASADPFERLEGRGPGVDEHNALAELLALAAQTDTPLAFPVTIEAVPDDGRPAPPVDVWPVLRQLRFSGTDATADGEIGLDHLMFGAATIMGNPLVPHASSINGLPLVPHASANDPSSSYAQPGYGGHGPVSVVIAAPEPTGACTPRVVVLDTGVGDNVWFSPPHRPVNRTMTLSGGQFVGMDVGTATAPSASGSLAIAVADRMTGELASHAGHGTFIAGLLRQRCPDADITVLRVMDGDGVVPEWCLSKALLELGIKLGEEPGCFDALVLSLGYYPELPDQNYVSGQKRQLLTIARRGAVTFAAAGNDCTERRSYPAAFSAATEFNPTDEEFAAAPTLPLVAVAALNPDRTTVALFSNDGDWVNGQAVGANLVSTAPKYAQGSVQASISVIGPNGRRRSTIDPDNYSSGFATWSGTSFAAPVLAGKYLHRLVTENCVVDVSLRRTLVPLRTSVASKKAAEQ